ncbi:hypothetical protein B0H14DRAFT_2599053 [Mycena olivaceomarginata]|nr:hypothetical protein B0H14DRAFT_2599053 [Mycena olivaceomarginata]
MTTYYYTYGGWLDVRKDCAEHALTAATSRASRLTLPYGMRHGVGRIVFSARAQSRHQRRRQRAAGTSRKQGLSTGPRNAVNFDSHSLPRALRFRKALSVVGPHIRRWRTLALRGWRHQVHQLYKFLSHSPGASQLQSVHISLVDVHSYYSNPTPQPSVLPWQLFRSTSLRSLRVNGMRLDLSDSTAFRTLRSLDISFETGNWAAPAFRRILGGSSLLETLVIRGFYPEIAPVGDPLDVPTIKSLAVSFKVPFYYRNYYSADTGGFDTFTNAFSLPNLEYLEILGGFTGASEEEHGIIVPEEWEMLALVATAWHSFNVSAATSPPCSSSIPGGNSHLLQQRGDEVAWPALRALTVETRDGSPNPRWLGQFLAVRPILELTIPRWPSGVTLPAKSPPKLRWLNEGPSPALMDGADFGSKFYIDDYDMRPRDFVELEVPEPDWLEDYLYYDEPWEWRMWQVDWMMADIYEQLDAELAQVFGDSVELLRAKGLCRELRKQRRKDSKVRRERTRRQKSVRQRGMLGRILVLDKLDFVTSTSESRSVLEHLLHCGARFESIFNFIRGPPATGSSFPGFSLNTPTILPPSVRFKLPIH